MGEFSPAAFLDTLPTGLCIHVRSIICYANPALLRMTGVPSLEAARGRSILEFVHPDFHAVTGARMREMYERRAPADWLELRFLRADGSSFEAEVAASMIEWEGQAASQVLITDITRRKEAERARIEAEQRYRRLIEHMPIALVVHTDGRIVYSNPATARLLGLPEGSDGVGKDPFERIHPDFRDEVRDRVRRIYGKEGHEPPMAVRMLRRDGSEFDAEISSTMIDWNGRPASQVLIVDAGAQRALEQRLCQAQKVESLQLLAGGVAHDFNNLLVGILGNAELAAAESSQGAVRAHLAGISLAARRAAELARQLLSYAGKGNVVRETLDLGALLDETSALMAASMSPKARLVAEPCAGLPAVFGDATQLRQVLMNLLANASEALESSGGVVRVTAGAGEFGVEELRSSWFADDVAAGRYAYFEVSDDGCGMTEAVLARIFDPFFSTKLVGRGLGLAVARGILLAHRGVIQVRSAPGKGTTFRVLLPATDGSPGPRDQAAESRPAKEEEDGGAITRAVVLVIDDEPQVRAVIEQVLRRAGHEVVSAADGASGVETYRERGAGIDGVVLDIGMPGMDGREVLAALRRIRRDVRVVVCSGYGDVETQHRIGAAKPAAVVCKPFGVAELLAAVEAAVARRGE
ncbi:MAG: PAS domain S-box protein [Deltaproteobacteria bacterium]|nr:PAS domain S-box protein [Deltaproteobacteria bacterium]